MSAQLEPPPHACEAVYDSEFRSLNSVSSVREFWQLLRAVLARVVPHHSVSLYFNYFGPDDAFRVLHHQQLPGSVVPWPERRKLSPAPEFLRRHPGTKTYRLRQILPEGATLRDSDYFLHVMQVEGWATLLGHGFWDGTRLVALLVLRRSAEQGEFGPEDIHFLERWHPHLRDALVRIQTTDEEAVLKSCFSSCLDAMSVGVMIFDWDLRLKFMNSTAARRCAGLKDGVDRACAPHPDCDLAVPNTVSEALHAAKAEALAPNCRETPADARRGIQVQALSPVGLSLARPCFLVQIFPSADGEASRRSEASTRLACLTRCEREVALLAADGYSNGEIAARLRKSERTVASQMGAVLGKLGFASRVMIARLVAGTG